MNVKENELAYVARLESLMFDSKLESGTPSQKADILRNIIVHLNCAPYQKIVCEETSNRFSDTYEKKYAEIVDCFDETIGLNNFAAGALALCAGKKNESQSWTSSMNMEVLNELPGFQNFKKDCKAKEDLFAKTKENSVPLFKPRIKKLVVKNKPEIKDVEMPSYFTSAKTSVAENTPATTNIVPSFSSAPLMPQNTASPMPQNTAPPNTSKVLYNQNGNNPYDKQGNFHACGSNKFTSNQGFDEHHARSPNGSARYSQRKSLFSSGKNSNFSYPSGKSYQKKTDWRKRQREEDDEEEGNSNERPAIGPFKTAKEQLIIDQQKKNGNQGRGQVQNYNQGQVSTSLYGAAKKSLGTRRGPSSKFVPPVMNKEGDGDMMLPGNKQADGNNDEPVDERLKGIDPKMIELITNEIMDHGPKLHWDDVAGLEFAKKTIKEIVVWPMLRPDIFTGLRGPPKGLLLFGPPGTGKTLIGKCIASQSKSTFFCISASSLTSKWVGEGEKMVRALFAVARCNQPAVVFIDEIDSLLSQRSDNEHEASRRIKTEFLVQLDGAATDSEDRILIIGATNRPQEIDEAARRRLVKRLYIPLPETIARRQIVVNLMSQQKHQLSDADLDLICEKTEGYSGSDMANLCREAALGPIRSIPFDQIETITNDEVRAINIDDFLESLMQVRASVSSKDLDLYIEWNKLYGSFGK